MSELLDNILRRQATIMDSRGLIPPPPPEMGVESLSEGLNDGSITIDIDGAYPQSIGIDAIRDCQTRFAELHWEILHSREGSSFITSDYPIAINETPNPEVVDLLVPLTSSVAIRFSHGTRTSPFPSRGLNSREVRDFNKLMIRSAESVVFSSFITRSLRRLVASNSEYEIRSGKISQFT